MAKILYALSGEGFGHATRTHVMIKKLSKFHDVKVVCGGKAYGYLSEHFKNIETIQSLHIKYANNKVSSIGTLFLNISSLFGQISSYRKIKKIIKTFQPDVIINDFEHLTAYAALFSRVSLFSRKNIPLISIGNHHVISNASYSIKLGHLWAKFKSLLVIKIIVPYADYHYISSFFFPKFKRKHTSDSEYLPIIVRDQIRKLYGKKLNSSNKGHVLVYQTSMSNNNLFDVLKKIDKKFIIYGFGKDKKDANLQFKSFSEKRFFDDLASCEAVITNGGFSLISEALYLKKPIFSEPVKQQFEQILNAVYLEKLGYGMFVEETDKRNLLKFFSNLDKYKNKLRKLDIKQIDRGLNSAIKVINKNIKELMVNK